MKDSIATKQARRAYRIAAASVPKTVAEYRAQIEAGKRLARARLTDTANDTGSLPIARDICRRLAAIV